MTMYGDLLTHKGAFNNTAGVLKIGTAGDSGHVFANDDILIHSVQIGPDKTLTAPGAKHVTYADSPDDTTYTDRLAWPVVLGGTVSIEFPNPRRIPKGSTGRFTAAASGTAGDIIHVNVTYSRAHPKNP